MKLILLLVAFTANCRDLPGAGGTKTEASTIEAEHFPGGPVEPGLTDEDQYTPSEPVGPDSMDEKQPLSDGGSENHESAGVDQQLTKVEKEQYQRKLRRFKCKARNACVVMGGFCVTNATLCGGRLVPEGCKGTNCQCCVPGTLEAKFENLEKELQAFRKTMNNSVSNINSELQSLKVNTIQMNSNLNSKLNNMSSSLNSSLINVYSNLNSKLSNMNSSLTSRIASIERNQGCPEGLFNLSTSYQCFKFFTDTGRSYTDAKTKCQDQGLVLAKPVNPVELRSYLVKNYAGKWARIGARGTGSVLRWDQDGTTLSSSNSAWYPGHPSGKTSSSHCLILLTSQSYMTSQPTKPYYSETSCTSTSYHALCELVIK